MIMQFRASSQDTVSWQQSFLQGSCLSAWVERLGTREPQPVLTMNVLSTENDRTNLFDTWRSFTVEGCISVHAAKGMKLHT